MHAIASNGTRTIHYSGAAPYLLEKALDLFEMVHFVLELLYKTVWAMVYVTIYGEPKPLIFSLELSIFTLHISSAR